MRRFDGLVNGQRVCGVSDGVVTLTERIERECHVEGVRPLTASIPDATILVFEGIVFILILFSESLYGRWKFFREKNA